MKMKQELITTEIIFPVVETNMSLFRPESFLSCGCSLCCRSLCCLSLSALFACQGGTRHLWKRI